MSDDLVKRLRLGACALEIEQAADRIEELEEVLREVDAWVDDLLPYAQEDFEPATVFKRVKEVLNK